MSLKVRRLIVEPLGKYSRHLDGKKLLNMEGERIIEEWQWKRLRGGQPKGIKGDRRTEAPRVYWALGERFKARHGPY